MTEPIAVTGWGNNELCKKIMGETGNPADVILDAQGGSEVMRLFKNILVSGVTMMNGCNASFTSTAIPNRAAGVRIGSPNSSYGTLCVVSNCVITCCTNAFTDSTTSGSTVIYGGAVCVCDEGLLVDSIVTNNTAVYRSAGVVMVNGTMRGCTVADNTAQATFDMLNVPGGKRLVYTHVNMPMTAISDFAEKGKTDPFFAELDRICSANKGLWCKEAEDYLLAHAPKVEIGEPKELVKDRIIRLG